MTTCSEFLYIELGQVSVKTQILMKQWRFWKKVEELSDDDPLSYVVALAKRYKLKETKHYEQLVDTHESVDEIRTKFEEEVKATIRLKAARGQSKYIAYLHINPSLETPTVYKNVYRKKDVSMIAKLRMSAHNLQIEMGRRTNTPRNERKYKCGEVEDEDHFLLHCSLYRDIRLKYNVRDVNITELLNDEKWIKYISDLYERKNDE